MDVKCTLSIFITCALFGISLKDGNKWNIVVLIQLSLVFYNHFIIVVCNQNRAYQYNTNISKLVLHSYVNINLFHHWFEVAKICMAVYNNERNNTTILIIMNLHSLGWLL